MGSTKRSPPPPPPPENDTLQAYGHARRLVAALTSANDGDAPAPVKKSRAGTDVPVLGGAKMALSGLKGGLAGAALVRCAAKGQPGPRRGGSLWDDSELQPVEGNGLPPLTQAQIGPSTEKHEDIHSTGPLNGSLDTSHNFPQVSSQRHAASPLPRAPDAILDAFFADSDSDDLDDRLQPVPAAHVPPEKKKTPPPAQFRTPRQTLLTKEPQLQRASSAQEGARRHKDSPPATTAGPRRKRALSSNSSSSRDENQEAVAPARPALRQRRRFRAHGYSPTPSGSPRLWQPPSEQRYTPSSPSRSPPGQNLRRLPHDKPLPTHASRRHGSPRAHSQTTPKHFSPDRHRCSRSRSSGGSYGSPLRRSISRDPGSPRHSRSRSPLLRAARWRNWQDAMSPPRRWRPRQSSESPPRGRVGSPTRDRGRFRASSSPFFSSSGSPSSSPRQWGRRRTPLDTSQQRGLRHTSPDDHGSSPGRVNIRGRGAVGMRADRSLGLQRPLKATSPGPGTAPPPRGRGAVFGRRMQYQKPSQSPPVVTHVRTGIKKAEEDAVAAPPRPQGWESASPEPIEPQGNLTVSLSVKQRAAGDLSTGAVSTSGPAVGRDGGSHATLMGSSGRGNSGAQVLRLELGQIPFFM
jgi:hypothetical protein